ncbi:hypothetical protein BDZ97DRAFT_1816290 [Flammula alnicola]|nr:hypothetical protein BDZ97DRAFT_1816290 [Flammula alnicola]
MLCTTHYAACLQMLDSTRTAACAWVQHSGVDNAGWTCSSFRQPLVLVNDSTDNAGGVRPSSIAMQGRLGYKQVKYVSWECVVLQVIVKPHPICIVETQMTLPSSVVLRAVVLFDAGLFSSSRRTGRAQAGQVETCCSSCISLCWSSNSVRWSDDERFRISIKVSTEHCLPARDGRTDGIFEKSKILSVNRRRRSRETNRRVS